MGLISNTEWSGFSFDRALAGLDILKYFKIRVYSGDIGIKKPDPRIFEYALSLTNTAPKNLLYVGNQTIKDIIPAKKIGWKTALLKSNEESSNGEADFEISSLHELLPIIIPGISQNVVRSIDENKQY